PRYAASARSAPGADAWNLGNGLRALPRGLPEDRSSPPSARFPSRALGRGLDRAAAVAPTATDHAPGRGGPGEGAGRDGGVERARAAPAAGRREDRGQPPLRRSARGPAGDRLPVSDEAFDYVIVGSGAGGASAARTLADATGSLAIVEEGPAVSTAEFSDRSYPTLARLYREMGAQVTRGRAPMLVIQGRCVGGSTVVNSAIMRRLPEEVWAEWR